MKKTFWAIGTLIVMAIATAVLQGQTATPTLPSPTVEPRLLAVGTSSQITVTIPITNSTVLPTGVNLVEVSTNGLQIVLAQMNDSGQNGDQQANDGIYSIRLPFNPSATGTFSLEVSAAFKGLLKRVISPAVPLSVYSSLPGLPPDPGLGGTTSLNGIDSDGDGVRDDVERYIALTYSSSLRMQASVTQIAIAELDMIANSSNSALSQDYAKQELYGLDCLSAATTSSIPSILSAVRAQVANTPDRSTAYLQAAGQVKQLFYSYPINPATHCLIDPITLPN